MLEVFLVLGGSGSGKSAYAEQLAERMQLQVNLPVYYLATGIIADDEFAQRVKRHQIRRPASWNTVEEGYDLVGAIARSKNDSAIYLVDGIGTWLSNLIFLHKGFEASMDAELENHCLHTVQTFINSWETTAGIIILVADEAGMGVVPEHALGRAFRDINGQVNQALARAAQNVYWVVAGHPMCIKGREKNE